MLWIGLTGSMGSGKSTAAKVLRSLGFPVLDADQIVHELLAPGTPVEKEIIQTFGPAVQGADGNLDRRALGQLVFSNSDHLAKLESLLHPKVRGEVAKRKSQLWAQGVACAFYDVPLLFEKKMEDQFDYIVVVSADPDLRRARIKARMRLTDAEIDARMTWQIPPQIKEAAATAVILNNADEENLKAEILAMLKRLNVALPLETPTSPD